MEIEELAKKIDIIAERLRLYMSEDSGGPAVGLLLAGTHSNLAQIAHHLRNGEAKIDEAMLILSEMKALLGENTSNMRALRNKFYCVAGEREMKAEQEKLATELETKPEDEHGSVG